MATDTHVVNRFGVPKKIWNKWTLVGRHVFNKTYEYMIKSPDHFRHPKDQVVEVVQEHWKTTAWNASWMAADVCSRGEKYLLNDLTLKVKGNATKTTVREDTDLAKLSYES